MFALDYSRFEIRVSGSAIFVAFLEGLPTASELRTKLQNMVDTLKEKPDAGEYVQRNLWPHDYRNMDLENLFRYEVDDSRRATYTIRRRGLKIDVYIIEFFSAHKEYERRFHY